MKRITFILVSLFFLCTSFVAGQQTITREEFWKPIREASAKARHYPRRHVQKINSIWNGVKTQEAWTYEYQPPDRIRYIHMKTRDGKTQRIEQINIGEKKYCKKDAGVWLVSASYCIGGSGSGGPSNIITEEYRREKTKLKNIDVVTYSNHTVYTNTNSKTVQTDGPSYWDSKHWFDNDGLILRSEHRRGLLKEPEPYYQQVETYEYDPKIKVEAPIK